MQVEATVWLLPWHGEPLYADFGREGDRPLVALRHASGSPLAVMDAAKLASGGALGVDGRLTLRVPGQDRRDHLPVVTCELLCRFAGEQLYGPPRPAPLGPRSRPSLLAERMLGAGAATVSV